METAGRTHSAQFNAAVAGLVLVRGVDCQRRQLSDRPIHVATLGPRGGAC
jgi:hypothetical protein